MTFSIPSQKEYDEFYLNECIHPFQPCKETNCKHWRDNDCTHPSNPLELRRQCERLQDKEKQQDIHPKQTTYRT